MIMKAGQQWHCINPACHCEVLVQATGEIEGGNPRCACGAAMKKKYARPTFSYLDFLSGDEIATAIEHSHEG
jgi:hypothetical protein